MRTIEQGVTVFSSSEIRVALLPVGPVPLEVLQEYCELIERYRHVDLTAVRSFYHEKQKSPLKYLPWSEGSMHFRFVQEKSASQMSPLTALHASRAILGVIGVCHCPASPDISLAYTEFEKLAKQFSAAAALRCFAFQPLGDEQQDSKKNEHLVMFPPGDETHIEQHVEVLMHDFAACVLMELQQRMLRTTIGSMSLVTTIDEPSFSGVLGVTDDTSKKLGSEEEVRQRRRHTRLEKRLGDWCLLAGSPKDAIEHYVSCTEIAKMSGDVVWSAAALEGLAESRVIEALISAGTIPGSKNEDAEVSLPDSPGSEVATPMSKALRLESSMGFGGMSLWRVIKQVDGLENQVEATYSGAGQVYQRRGILPLQIEVELKRVRFIAGLHGKVARAQVSDILTQIMDQWPLLSSEEDRVNVVVEAAQVLGLVGCYRKRVLLIWQALEAVRNHRSSDMILLDSALKSLDPPGDHENQDKGEFRRMEWSLGSCGLPQKEWYLLQRAMLEALLPAASRAGSQVYVWEACAALLRDHHAALSGENQTVLMDAMKKASEALDPSNRMRPGPGPPPLFQIRVVSALRPDLRPAKVFGSLNCDGPFLFNPLALKRAKEQGQERIKWVVGEECSLEVYIANPTSIETKLERLSLYGAMEDDGIGGQGYQKVPVSVVLPARTKPTRVALAIVPQTPGMLNVTGVLVTLFGVTWLQKFVPNLKRAPMPEGSVLVEAPNCRRERHMMVAVEVIPELPLLKLCMFAKMEFLGVQFEEFDSQVPSSSPSANGKDAGHPKVQVVTVYEGQIVECSVKITNCSKVPVSVATIECKQPRNSGDVLGISVDLMESALEDALPMAVGGTVEVPISLKVECSRAAPSVMSPLPLEVVVQYRGPSENVEDGGGTPCFGREARMNVQFRSLPAIEVVSMKMRNEYVLNGTTPESASNAQSTFNGIDRLSYCCVIDLDVVNHMDTVADLWLESYDSEQNGKEVPLCGVCTIQPRAVVTLSCPIPYLEARDRERSSTSLADEVACFICSKIRASWQVARPVETPRDEEPTEDTPSVTDPGCSSRSLRGIVPLPQPSLAENLSALMLGRLSREMVMVSVRLAENTQNQYVDIRSCMPQSPVQPGRRLSLDHQPSSRVRRSISSPLHTPQETLEVPPPDDLDMLIYEPCGPNKEVWGVKAGLGEIVECEMVVENNSDTDVSLCLTLCADALGPEVSMGDNVTNASGLLILGVVGNILLDVHKGTVKKHRFSICPTTTGAFEVFACGEIRTKESDNCDNDMVHGMKLNLCCTEI